MYAVMMVIMDKKKHVDIRRNNKIYIFFHSAFVDFTYIKEVRFDARHGTCEN